MGSSGDSPFDQLQYVSDALEDAEALLKFASESGITVDFDTRNHVLHARAMHAHLDEASTANLLAALSTQTERFS